MVVRLRFARHGERNKPFFHLVAIEIRKARDAKPIEKLGEYNPIPQPCPDEPGVLEKRTTLDAERIRHWLGVGAIPSKPVAKLLEKTDLLPSGKLFKGTAAYREVGLKKLAARSELPPAPE